MINSNPSNGTSHNSNSSSASSTSSSSSSIPSSSSSSANLLKNSINGVMSSSVLSNQMDSRVNRCRVCDKTYARPSTLKTHMRTHSVSFKSIEKVPKLFIINFCALTGWEAVQMRQMQQGVHSGGQSDRSLAHPLRRETVLVRDLQPQVFAELLSHHTHENSFWRTALCVSTLGIIFSVK